ncbi:partial Type II secretion system protein E, partial [Patescibacteria group bacterium]
LYKPVGCEECNGLGYRGRLAIIEFLPISNAIRQAIITHDSSEMIKKLAIEEGMMTLYEDGLAKVTQGLTTLEEVLRVTTDA